MRRADKRFAPDRLEPKAFATLFTHRIFELNP
jgi:hypothetical protein